MGSGAWPPLWHSFTGGGRDGIDSRVLIHSSNDELTVCTAPHCTDPYDLYEALFVIVPLLHVCTLYSVSKFCAKQYQDNTNFNGHWWSMLTIQFLLHMRLHWHAFQHNWKGTRGWLLQHAVGELEVNITVVTGSSYYCDWMIDVVWYGAEVTEKLQFLLISLHRHFSKKEFMQYPEPAPLCLCVLGFNTFACCPGCCWSHLSPEAGRKLPSALHLPILE